MNEAKWNRMDCNKEYNEQIELYPWICHRIRNVILIKKKIVDVDNENDNDWISSVSVSVSVSVSI